jgi:adenylate cyclase
LDIQKETQHLAAEFQRGDGVDLQLRIGLKSGQVITGEIGSTTSSYTAIGQPVGMAQRMESVARPGGVMLSESTARLVEHFAPLGEPELVHINGADMPVAARRLLATAPSQGPGGRQPLTVIGRDWEMSTIRGFSIVLWPATGR